MASLLGLLRKTLKRGTNVVRRVGKVSRNTLRKGTNAVGLTRKRRSSRHRGRKH
jgi:hypothetical protein